MFPIQSKKSHWTFSLLLAVVLSACTQAPQATQPAERKLPEAEVPTLRSTRILDDTYLIDDLMVLVFPAQSDSRRWRGVFDKAFQMRELQKQARIISQAVDADFEKLSGLLERISLIATDLYQNDTVSFLTMNGDAGCQIRDLTLNCLPEFDTLPGAPRFDPFVTMSETTRNGRKIADSLVLKLSGTSTSRYALELVLSPETFSESESGTESTWSGTVKVIPGSRFERGAAHAYGYAEMRLKKVVPLVIPNDPIEPTSLNN